MVVVIPLYLYRYNYPIIYPIYPIVLYTYTSWLYIRTALCGSSYVLPVRLNTMGLNYQRLNTAMSGHDIQYRGTSSPWLLITCGFTNDPSSPDHRGQIARTQHLPSVPICNAAAGVGWDLTPSEFNLQLTRRIRQFSGDVWWWWPSTGATTALNCKIQRTWRVAEFLTGK